MIMREFNESDWDAFGGAESFSTGKAPLIAYGVVETPTDREVVVIGDVYGVHVMAMNEDGQVAAWQLDLKDNRKIVRLVMSALPTRLTVETLGEYGFVQVTG